MRPEGAASCDAREGEGGGMTEISEKLPSEVALRLGQIEVHMRGAPKSLTPSTFSDTFLVSLFRDYEHIEPSDVMLPTQQAMDYYEVPLRDALERTTNEGADDYWSALRSELDRQTGILRRNIETAKSETIETLQSECSVLRQQNAVLEEQHATLECQVKELGGQLAKVGAQNAEMSQLFSAKYLARNLFLGSSVVSLAMVGALAGNILRGVTVIDPFLAGVALFIAIGFMGLAGVRAQREKRERA